MEEGLLNNPENSLAPKIVENLDGCGTKSNTSKNLFPDEFENNLDDSDKLSLSLSLTEESDTVSNENEEFSKPAKKKLKSKRKTEKVSNNNLFASTSDIKVFSLYLYFIICHILMLSIYFRNNLH